MLNLRLALSIVGLLLIGLSGLMAVPLFVDLYAGDGENATAFFSGALASVFAGGILHLANRGGSRKVGIRDAFFLTVFSWTAMCLVSSLPLYFSSLNLSLTDAVFETVSGLTTTGASILTDFESVPAGILIWRSLLQWLGGLGVIPMALIILPYLRIGGMQLFQDTSTRGSQKTIARPGMFGLVLVLIYGGLTVVCALLYALCGMSAFDAVNHAMTTLSTGGYSTHAASMGHFQSFPVYWTAILFMLLGALPFSLYIRFLVRGDTLLFRDSQVHFFLGLVAAAAVFVTFFHWLADIPEAGHDTLFASLTHSLFTVVSIITTTGYATADYTLWGTLVLTIVFFLTYLGGCAGSTAGGLKAIRLQVALQSVHVQFMKLLYPSGVFIPHFRGMPIDHRVILSVLSFLFIYVFVNAAVSLLLALCGLDFMTAISGAASAIANVGPGIGGVIGPAGSYASLPDTAKWILCAAMLLGRLELMAVTVLFSVHFWKR